MGRSFPGDNEGKLFQWGRGAFSLHAQGLADWEPEHGWLSGKGKRWSVCEGSVVQGMGLYPVDSGGLAEGFGWCDL